MAAGGPEWSRVLVSAFSCYFDASGTQHDQDVIAVAGLMTTAEDWVSWESARLARLKRERRTYFHRKELGAPKYQSLLSDLAATIHQGMRKFGMVVIVKELHTKVPRQEYDHWRLDAYSYAGRACAAYVRIWAKRNHLRCMPELFFAKGDTGRKQLETRLRLDGFDAVHFRPAKDELNQKTGLIEPSAVPLQAADMLAYELFDMTRYAMLNHRLRPANDVWTHLNKLPGDARVAWDESLSTFQERVRNFSPTYPSNKLVRLATWMPEAGGDLTENEK